MTHQALASHYRQTGNELQLHIHQLSLEAYKPAMDALKVYLEIFGSQSPNFYMTFNKQIAAACQMNGANDMNATRKQQICRLAMLELAPEKMMQRLEQCGDKDEVKKAKNNAINETAEFFGLGNKKTAKRRAKP